MIGDWAPRFWRRAHSVPTRSRAYLHSIPAPLPVPGWDTLWIASSYGMPLAPLDGLQCARGSAQLAAGDVDLWEGGAFSVPLASDEGGGHRIVLRSSISRAAGRPLSSVCACSCAWGHGPRSKVQGRGWERPACRPRIYGWGRRCALPSHRMLAGPHIYRFMYRVIRIMSTT